MQIAKHSSAARVIAAGRDADALAQSRGIGADATVSLLLDHDQLTAELGEQLTTDLDPTHNGFGACVANGQRHRQHPIRALPRRGRLGRHHRRRGRPRRGPPRHAAVRRDRSVQRAARPRARGCSPSTSHREPPADPGHQLTRSCLWASCATPTPASSSTASLLLMTSRTRPDQAPAATPNRYEKGVAPPAWPRELSGSHVCVAARARWPPGLLGQSRRSPSRVVKLTRSNVVTPVLRVRRFLRGARKPKEAADTWPSPSAGCTSARLLSPQPR